MPELIDPNSNYEPSDSSKSRWLYTRKNKLHYSDITLPGLFQTYNFKVDTYMFLAVLGLEAYGVYVLWVILPNPMFAFIGLAMDVLAAIFAHLPKKIICLAKNRLLLAEKASISFTEGKNSTYETNKQKGIIFRYRLGELFLYLVIIVLALVKILTVFSFASSAAIVPGLKILIGMIYLTTAYIHINHTGYFVFEMWFRYFAKKEKQKVNFTNPELYLSNNIKDGIVFDRIYKLKNDYTEGRINKQSIKHDKGQIYLYNWGILQDSELQGLVELQDGDKQKQLAFELLQCQMDMLQKDACRAQTMTELYSTQK